MSEEITLRPPSTNINAIKRILGKSKQVMQRVESGEYETGSVDPTSLQSDPDSRLSEAQMAQQGYTPKTTKKNIPNQQNMGRDEYINAVKNSKMPSAIKKAMIENQIPQTNPYEAINGSFSLDDVEDLIEEDAPQSVRQENNTNHNPYTRTTATSNRNRNKQPVNENMIYTGSNTITINEDELRGMMKEMIRTEVEKFKKQLTEDAIRKTISTLIKEGKISVKRKKKRRS